VSLGDATTGPEVEFALHAFERVLHA